MARSRRQQWQHLGEISPAGCMIQGEQHLTPSGFCPRACAGLLKFVHGMSPPRTPPRHGVLHTNSLLIAGPGKCLKNSGYLATILCEIWVIWDVIHISPYVVSLERRAFLGTRIPGASNTVATCVVLCSSFGGAVNLCPDFYTTSPGGC